MAIQLGSILLWGLFATSVLTVITSGSQQLGWSRMSLPYMLGTTITGHRGWAMAAGFAAHLVLGCLFALLYAFVFESWNRATWWIGGLLGLYHGLFMLIVFMQVLPSVHPRMASKHHGPTPTKQLEPPGFLALNYGRRTPLISLVAHVAYGALLSFYSLS